MLLELVYLSCGLCLVKSDSNTNYPTCGDWMKNAAFNTLSNGVYKIHNNDTKESLDVYCSFDYTRNYSFTLIESGSFAF